VLRSSFSAIIRKTVYTLAFDRSTIMTEAGVRKLRTARDKGGILVSTPSAVKSVMLRYIENLTLEAQRESVPGLAETRKYRRFVSNQAKLRTAITLLREQGVLLCDEVDMLLHSLKSELNFPIGPKLDIDFRGGRWEYPMFLLSFLLAADRYARDPSAFPLTRAEEAMPLLRESGRAVGEFRALASALEEGYQNGSLLRVPHLVLLNLDFYESRLRPVALRITSLWMDLVHFDDSILAASFVVLPGGETVQVTREMALGDKLLVRVPESPVRVAAEDGREPSYDRIAPANVAKGRSFQILNLCHDWLRSFFPHCMTKIDRVSFGIMTDADYRRALALDPLMPRTRWKLAIPFVAKDVPSRASEFAHPDVVIGLTFLAFRLEGLRFDDFGELVSHLRVELSAEVGPLRDRKSYLMWEAWVAGAGGKIRGAALSPAAVELDEDGEPILAEEAEDEGEVVSLWLLKRSDDRQMAKAFRLLRRHPPVVDYVLTTMIYPIYLRYQRTKISASGQELGGSMLFPRRVGFSGTPSALLPRELGQTRYEMGADGLMLTVMTDPAHVSHELIDPDWDARSLLRRIAQRPFAERFSALIDTGALITGLTNEQAAAFLLENGLEWAEGCVFLDGEDKKKVLVRATKRVVDLNQSGIEPTRLFALFDQVRLAPSSLSLTSASSYNHPPAVLPRFPRHDGDRYDPPAAAARCTRRGRTCPSSRPSTPGPARRWART
jgi:hypothetical protein